MTTCSTSCGKRAALRALLVVIVAASACTGSSTGGHETSRRLDLRLPELTNVVADVTTPAPVEPPRAGSAAPTPRDAVDRFVAAEAAGDIDASYDLLARSTRDVVRSREVWRQARSARPALRAFTATAAPAITLDGGSATVQGDARLTPRLDEVGGLVPARAAITWTAVAEDGGWRVAFDRTAITAMYPSETGATETARAWIDAARACRPPDPALVVPTGIVGVTGYASLLCGAGDARLDPPTVLGDRPDPSPVLAAYGPDAASWARLVRVTGPRSFAIVLAPLDDRWIVIGVLAAGP